MTSDQAASNITTAINALTKVREELRKMTFRADLAIPGIEVQTEYGQVNVDEDGTVTIVPRTIIIERAVTDAHKFYSFVVKPAGSVCPTCAGRGTV